MIYQKERPLVFDQVKGQDHIVRNIRNQSIRDMWFHVYILEGQFGSGKTTIARIIARAANCEHKDSQGNPCLQCKSCQQIAGGGMDFMEIDGADQSSVEDIRKLKETVSFLPVALKHKVIIIDEVHKLSNSAFNCLLKVLEEPPEYMIFILCTTQKESIPATVQSRAACYQFNRLPQNIISEHLMDVARKYGLSITREAANLLADYSDGSMRNALVLFEQAEVYGTDITESVCMDLLGICGDEILYEVLLAFLCKDMSKLIVHLDQLEKTGKSFLFLANKMMQGCADLIMAFCHGMEGISGTTIYINSIEKLVSSYTLNDFCFMAEAVKDLPFKLKDGGSKYEFILYVVSAFQEMQDNNIVMRLEMLEKKMSSTDIRAISEPNAMPVKHVETQSVTMAKASLPDTAADMGLASVESGNTGEFAAKCTQEQYVEEHAEIKTEVNAEKEESLWDDEELDSLIMQLNDEVHVSDTIPKMSFNSPESPASSDNSLKQQLEDTLKQDQDVYETYLRCVTREIDGKIEIECDSQETETKLLIFLGTHSFTNVFVKRLETVV